MKCRCEVSSKEGLVQYLAANLLPGGYWFYVAGQIPESKAPEAVDQKLIAKYEAGLSRQARWRRRRAGLASIRYVRWGRRFLLLATHGHHVFFEEEGTRVRDIRRVPLAVAGYSISYKPGHYLRRRSGESAQPDDRWHARVRIGERHYRRLKRVLMKAAIHWPLDRLGRAFYQMPFEPYAPVRQQLLNLLRLVNKARQTAGLEKLPYTVLRYRRHIVKPLGDSDCEPTDALPDNHFEDEAA